MWQRHIEIILDPNHIPQKGKITQHFRPPQLKSRQPQKRKEQQKTTPNKKKKKETKISQSHMSKYFIKPTIATDHTPSDPPSTPPTIEERRFATQGLR